jgi:phosphatidylserine decarboxylase
MPLTQKPVKDLITLLASNNALKEAVETSLQHADLPGIKTLQEFYVFLEEILTHIPSEKELISTEQIA